MTAPCPHPDSWFSRELCEEPCGSMHYYCTECGALVDFCENVEMAREAAAAAAGLCVACESAPSTTTCGVPNHPCQLCVPCRRVLDGSEWDDD